MSTLRVSNIEAKADVSSPTVDEKIKFTNSSGDVLFHLDGKTSGITTVGINTTGNTFTVNNTTGDVSFSGSVTSSGVSTFTSDVSIADKIVHIGDTDTAIRFPAADTITAETGGTERLRITSSGQFIMPAGSFDLMVGDSVDSNAGTQTISVGSTASGAGGIQLWANPTNGNSWVQFGDNSASASQYRGWVNYQHADDNLNFGTAGTERLRITSSGNVGIGTDNPQGKLVVSNGSAGLEFNPNSGQAIVSYNRITSAYTPIGLQGSTVGLYIGGVGEALRIDSSGNIGINSTSPKTNLDISQQTGAVALPQGTTAQRPSGTAPYIRKNTTNNALEYYDGTSWVEIITDYFPTGSVILG